MESKILGILESAKRMESDDVPSIEREDVAKLIMSIPGNIVSEYCEVLLSLAEEILLLKSIFSLDPTCRSFKHLIDGLNPSQLRNLSAIARNMANVDPNSKVNEVIDNTWSFTRACLENECDNVVK